MHWKLSAGMRCIRRRSRARATSKQMLGRTYRDPYIAATDYMKIVPDQIQRWIPGRFISLGTDGYGRSDARAALRDHFEVDRRYIVVTALQALADDGALDRQTVASAIEKYGIDPRKPDPVTL